MTADSESYVSIYDEDGNEQLYQILFTFHSDEYGKSYLLCYPAESSDDDEDVLVEAYSYTESDDESEGSLQPIESEEEWDMIEEVFNTFMVDEEN